MNENAYPATPAPQDFPLPQDVVTAATAVHTPAPIVGAPASQVAEGGPITPQFTAPAPAPQPEIKPVYKNPDRPKALFRLDDLENEKTNDPFFFEYEGETYEMFDPKDLDWQDLLIAQENPSLIIHILMPEVYRESFLSKKLSLRKLMVLMERWQQHFGLTAAGEAGGSARS